MGGASEGDPPLSAMDVFGVIVLVSLVLLLVLGLCFDVCVQCWSHCMAETHAAREAAAGEHESLPTFAFSEDDVLPTSGGLRSWQLASLPTFTYSTAETSPDNCVVCQSPFEENQWLRRLPRCNHSFHAWCVDQWLRCNASCPLCRSLVEPDSLVIELPRLPLQPLEDAPLPSSWSMLSSSLTTSSRSFSDEVRLDSSSSLRSGELDHLEVELLQHMMESLKHRILMLERESGIGWRSKDQRTSQRS